MTGLRVGFAEQDITPPLGLPLGGYGARTGGADAVLDPLSCRAAVFDDGSDATAIVTLDLVHVFGDWVATLRERAREALGIAADHIMIAAIHTHAGPGVFRSTIERDDQLASYEAALADRVLVCLTAARRSAVTAELYFGTAPVTGVAANRRDPALSADETVRLLAARGIAGDLLGVVANFACHATVLPADNHAYSGDLLGVAAQRAGARLGAPVLLTNGAAGDVSTRFTRREQTHAEVQRLAHILADAIAAGVRSARVVPASAPSLAAATGSVPVRWRDLPTPTVAAAQLQAAVEELEAVRVRESNPGAVRLAQAQLEGAQAELWITSHGGWGAFFGEREPIAQVQVLRCGDVAVVGVPGELFSAAGQTVQCNLDNRALVVGYANDYLGYLIPQADFAAGGYEALIAMVDPACEGAIRNGLVQAARAAGCRVRHNA